MNSRGGLSLRRGRLHGARQYGYRVVLWHGGWDEFRAELLRRQVAMSRLDDRHQLTRNRAMRVCRAGYEVIGLVGCRWKGGWVCSGVAG